MNCGYKWNTSIYKIINGSNCPRCVGKNRLSKEDILERFKKNNLILLSDYINANTKVKLKCLKCGTIFEKKPKYIFNRNSGCPECIKKEKVEKQKLTTDIIEKRLGNIELLEKYHGIKEKHLVKCLNCRYTWKTTVDLLFNATGKKCPKCSKKIPIWEEEMINVLKEKGIKYVILHYKLLSNKEIDIYLLECKLGIELNGLFWHSYHPKLTYKSKKWAENHLYQKKMEALKYGIDVIFIFEHEYHNKHIFNKIINYILAKIGINHKYIVYARKCKFEIINQKLANEFYEKYHILGRPSNCKHFGLIYHDEIVSMMSFKKYNGNSILLTRYCIKNNYKIIGGFNKLLKNSINKLTQIYNEEVNEIITFIDLRFVNPNDNVFVRNGFEKEKIIRPRYFYWKINNGKIITVKRENARRKCLSKILSTFDNKLTEEKNMFLNGFFKCYDAGKIKLTYH